MRSPSYRALALNPDHVPARQCGNALSLLNRHEDAIASYDRALALRPTTMSSAPTNRATALLALKRHEEAIAGYDQALAIKPRSRRCAVQPRQRRPAPKHYEEALANYQQTLRLQPHHPHALNGLAHCALAICDWTTTAALAGELDARVPPGRSIINPWMFLGFCDDPALQLECARNYARHKVPLRPPLWTGKGYRHDKMRIAYLSGDFHQHATACLIAELFELHDRARFEVVGVSFGPDDGSEMRARLVQAFDQFHDVSAKATPRSPGC